MGIQNPGFPILILVILTITQLSNGRHLHIRITIEASQERSTNEFYPRFSNHFSTTAAAAAPEKSRNDQVDPVYEVSHRTVPGGPNPLHN
ncbi:CLE12p like [Actinidia chinensis var. chinensis]|uniref:CLE12p like n=1 Tax=Actinidia chinensis var. chinensis TaxID=1590841 RepID=A0A2R6QNE1_ACTCC|nr:CLE12p like [Actinidia chinensis var. chinensis]